MKIIAIIVLIILSPLIVIISLLLFFQSGVKVIFTQQRIGLNQIGFTIYKFKTIEHKKTTFVGKFLRKSGLDEIPQLYNIIKGDMNFVGPRPLTQFDINRLNWNKPGFSKRWTVKPGITGLAQLSKTCNSSLALKNDIYYIKNKSFLLDIKLIVKSLLVPIIGKTTK
jgi:lipopolysaccharide/colanic/teichoic acid biosynthesis glycosyltransferase